MKKITDYSIIIFRNDGSIDYENFNVLEDGCYVLLLEDYQNIEDPVDVVLPHIMKANMVIGKDNCVLKCRWLYRPVLLTYLNVDGHYNFFMLENNEE